MSISNPSIAFEQIFHWHLMTFHHGSRLILSVAKNNAFKSPKTLIALTLIYFIKMQSITPSVRANMNYISKSNVLRVLSAVVLSK